MTLPSNIVVPGKAGRELIHTDYKHAAGRVVFLSGMLAALCTASAQERRPLPMPPTAPQPAPHVDSAAHRIFFGETAAFRLPKGWVVTRTLRNAVELAKPAGKGDAITLRSVLFQERRLNHEDAVRRLREMIASRTDPATFFEVAGWPAFQRSYIGPLAESAREPADHIGDSSAGPAEKPIATFIFTAIAAGEVVLQVETTAAPGAPDADIREARAFPQQAVLSQRQDTATTATELAALRNAKSPPVAVPVPTPPPPIPPPTRFLRRPPFNIPLPLPGTGAITYSAAVPGDAETAVAISPINSANVIIASNAGVQLSNDSGTTFSAPSLPLVPPTGTALMGDSSVTFGKTGNDYLSNVVSPAFMAPPPGICANSVFSSGNNGQVFAFAGNAMACPGTGLAACLPDEPFIVADSVNAAPTRGDQIYATWRNISPMSSTATACGTSGSLVMMISCSRDSASNWSTPQTIGTGDFPRLTVGSDGSVYVVLQDSLNVTLHKYTSCSAPAPLEEFPPFPITVTTGIFPTTCPIAGLDRCHPGIDAPTVAVDDTNPDHVYIAAVQGTPGPAATDNIVVFDSADGGVTWGRPITLNAPVSGRRFLPWLCSAAGNAYVGWYDRRAAAAPGAVSNDLTDYFLGSATTRNGRLRAETERNLTNAPDPECGHWNIFALPDAISDSESCSVQPQLAGACLKPSGTAGSFKRCDFSAPSCPAGEICMSGRGAPTYGDYNGIGCAPDRVISTWVSSAAPAGFTGTAPSGPTIFDDVEKVDGTLTISQFTVPAGDPGQFSIRVDNATVAPSVSNTTVGPFTESVTTPHRVSVAAAPGTPNAYSSSIGGDCDSDGTVHFSALRPSHCSVTSFNNGFTACLDTCKAADTACLRVAEGGFERRECVKLFNACTDTCDHAFLQITLQVAPSVDTGRFNLLLDGSAVLTNAATGASTGDQNVSPGAHTVTQSGAAGASLANYVTSFSGSCNAAGQITALIGGSVDCIVTNTRQPGTGADAQLIVKKVVIPATDPGKFNLLIDGNVVASNAGNNVTSTPTVVLEGTHRVSETGSGTNLSAYIRSFGGACDAAGNVTLLPGQSKTCIITNHRNPAQCLAACNVGEGRCMAGTHDSHERQGCVADRRECDRTCP